MSPALPAPAGCSFAHSARRIAALAWPMLVGQVAVVAFSTVDTILVAHYAAVDLAALAIGGAAYITVFIGLMGVVLAIAPIAGQLFGAGRPAEAGRQVHQAMWMALGVSVVGCALLLWPEPFLILSRATPEVADKARGYLAALAAALPAALLFTVYRGFNTAISRPKAVMVLQLMGLLLKVPLSALLVFGSSVPTPWGLLQTPELGAVGCGVATAIVMWAQWGAAVLMLRRDPFYKPFALQRGWHRPERASLAGLLRLGVPMGASILIEVSGFTFMAFFISRLGATPVAGHQIAANLVALLFMMPLAQANAASALVAQRVGADDPQDARRLAKHAMGLGLAIATVAATLVWSFRSAIAHAYSDDAVIIATAIPLIGWAAIFHVADATQCIAAFVLRAWRIATLPMVIYAVAIWGVGLGGGNVLAFDRTGTVPALLQGATGFWSAAAAGVLLAALSLTLLLAHRLRALRRAH